MSHIRAPGPPSGLPAHSNLYWRPPPPPHAVVALRVLARGVQKSPLNTTGN
jgi:hypothetical protein